MSEIFKIAASTAFFWMITFAVAYAYERSSTAPLGTKLLDATLLSFLLTVPVFLFICHSVLVVCLSCTG